MARYIEETEIYKLIEPHGTAKVHCSWIDELPRADVVPKSEVERWRRNLEAVLEEIPETKREFAREIFEEIENALAQMGIEFNCQPILYELKMKYTEGEK